MMREIFLIVLIALLASCNTNIDTDTQSIPQVGTLRVGLSLGRVDTRSVDGSIGAGYILPFSAINTLTVELYESLTALPIFTHQATFTEIEKIKATPTGGEASLFISDIPLNTKHVRVVINEFTETNPNINHLQITNSDTPLAPTMNRYQIPYEGVSSNITLLPAVNTERITVTATVEVGPVLSRFEITPGTIKVVDPAADGYTFDWTAGDAGKLKIKGYTATEINAAEKSAQENFKKKYGTDASASAFYSYRVRLVRQTAIANMGEVTSAHTDFYVNYFKQQLNDAALVKNINNGTDSWKTIAGGGTADYALNGAHSNLFDILPAPLTADKVIAYHLFPQKVAPDATVQEVKEGMPHIILSFVSTGSIDTRWLTIRAFRDKTSDKMITELKPGYCYLLDLDDVVLTPWSLALEVRVTDKTQTTDSDPIIKDFDPTANVPEPGSSELLIGITVRQWKSKDIVVEV